MEHFEKALASLQLSTRLKELEASEQVVCCTYNVSTTLVTMAILTMASEQVACTPAAINAAAASPEVVLRLELLVTDWYDRAEL